MKDITEETITSMDITEKIGESVIHHGKYNNRIYLMKYKEQDGGDNLLEKLDEMANLKGYSRIVAKVPTVAYPIFLKNGYTQEAYIPQYFNGDGALFFMAKYTTEERKREEPDILQNFSELLKNSTKAPVSQSEEIKPGIAQVKDCPEMARLYQTVFATYPFPISNPDYLQQTMEENSVIYFGIWNNGKLIALASAEMDAENKSAEMTDFAVLPTYRGKNIAGHLLLAAETKMREMGFKTLYTIARLNSFGMNKTFIKRGYLFSGVLKNNTNIAGQIESMNVYYKNIAK